jgi:hypothetical protein
MARGWTTVLSCLIGMVACSHVEPNRDSARDEPVPTPRTRAAPVTQVPVTPTASERCAAELARVEHAPNDPGAPEFERVRAEVVERARVDPVLFVREPTARGVGPEATMRRRAIFEAADPVKALFDAYSNLRKRPDIIRQVLLTDGYLYARSPSLSAALTSLVHAEDLFQSNEIWLSRGASLLRAVRTRGEYGTTYVYAEGPDVGRTVHLYLLDRIADRPDALAAPLHRDVSAVALELGFASMRVRHLAEDTVTADLRYGEEWVPTVLRSDGAALHVECEALPKTREIGVGALRDEQRRRDVVLAKLRAIMEEQVEEALPFDEPKREIGQEDGKLRQHWAWAYRYGASSFEFNDDRYPVFDDKGRPRVPQVCIDFVTDTFERAGGSWFRPRGEPRERIPGTLDFSTLGIDNERSVERFVDFAKTHPESFDVLELPDAERVPYAHQAEFFAHLAEHSDRYRPGDIVVIYGLRADGKMHYHSFIVYESDPVTGAPSLVAANAGRPRIRPWEHEMQSAPLRSIRARIRPRLGWLESIAGRSAGSPSSGPLPRLPTTI